MLVKTQNYLISVYRCNMLVKTQNYVISRGKWTKSWKSQKKKKKRYTFSLKVKKPAQDAWTQNDQAVWAQALAVAYAVIGRLLSCCHWMIGPGERVRVSVCIVLYCICICVCLKKASQQTQSTKKKKKKKKRKKNPARYVISIQISGERTAAAFVISVFTL